jgi:hypothetical protein
MKTNSCKLLTAFAITALGLTLTGCQQAPPTAVAAAPAPAQATPAPAPVSTTESSSSSRSVEVKTDPVGHDAPASVTVKKESTTEKQQSLQ